MHQENWLNCDAKQLIQAVKHVNDAGRERGREEQVAAWFELHRWPQWGNQRNLQAKHATAKSNQELGLMLRRINIRQVEGVGFQEVPRENSGDLGRSQIEIDTPMLQKVLPLERYSKMCESAETA